MYDLNSPEGRLAAAKALGPDGYNEAMRQHLERNTVATVNGYPIRKVASRFGQLHQIVGTNRAFYTFAEAEKFANAQPAKA